MTSNPAIELEANVFAMELLMPFDLVAGDIKGLDLTDDDKIEKLAARYRVPRGVMSLRIADVRAALEVKP